ncbi:uncharacterized protein V1518DRAFT_419775 [Limtongia smithiae]|uniref:uncharacterized protein n=1 Tax=Limtongia smithiae TaxID=1125753 RepID=UPI0034CDD276
MATSRICARVRLRAAAATVVATRRTRLLHCSGVAANSSTAKSGNSNGNDATREEGTSGLEDDHTAWVSSQSPVRHRDFRSSMTNQKVHKVPEMATFTTLTPWYHPALRQYIVPFADLSNIPDALVNEHPCYVPDSIGTLTALFASENDTFEERYSTRSLDHPKHNIMLRYMDAQKVDAGDFGFERLKLVKPFKPASIEDDRELSTLEVQDFESLFFKMNLTGDSVSTALEMWHDAHLHLSATQELARVKLFISYAIETGTWTPIATDIITDYWRRLGALKNTSVAVLYILFTEIERYVLREKLSRDASRMRFVVELRRVVDEFQNIYQIIGLPESCVDAYLRVLRVIDDMQSAMRILIGSRMYGLSTDPEIAMSVLAKLANTSHDSIAITPNNTIKAKDFLRIYAGTLRPYFVSRRNTSGGIKLLLRRVVKTPDEIFSVLELCTTAHNGKASLKENQTTFVQALGWNILRLEYYGATRQERQIVALAQIRDLIARIKRVLKDDFAEDEVWNTVRQVLDLQAPVPRT